MQFEYNMESLICRLKLSLFFREKEAIFFLNEYEGAANKNEIFVYNFTIKQAVEIFQSYTPHPKYKLISNIFNEHFCKNTVFCILIFYLFRKIIAMTKILHNNRKTVGGSKSVSTKIAIKSPFLRGFGWKLQFSYW